MASPAIWVDTPERWDRLAEGLLKAGEAGYDSETYGQPYRTSPQHRARVHHWSIAVLTNKLTPRNYHRAKGFALPREALFYPPLYDALRSVTLWAHNAPHDEHAARNEGRDLVIEDTLQWGRVAIPGAPGYGLKTKGRVRGIEDWALGKPGRDNFKELMAYRKQETVTRVRRVQRCVCGRVPCRARSTSEFLDPNDFTWKFHERREVEEPVEVTREVAAQYDVSEMGPDHPRWLDWLNYVVADAESAIEWVDFLRRRGYREKEYPWTSRNTNTRR